jgi:exodeoxyribonuclease VII large subunit
MTTYPLFAPREERTGLWTVSQLTARIRDALETDFARVALCGEISNVSRPRSGHIYFCLKDDKAQIRAVIWRSDAQRLVFDLADGLAVRAWGAVTVYPPRGEYQLVVRKLEPEGIGPLELAFRQTVARLGAEGLFDQMRKRPLPRFPRRIVVVTSPSGAAIRDLLQVVSRRWSGTEILIAPTRVQGAESAREVAAAIRLAGRVADAELIIVARGGGSLEDLWAFNEEVVARAIFAAPLPVVSAIGHEVDLTIADLVADRRALTPTEAGELCLPDMSEVCGQLNALCARLGRSASVRFAQARTTLNTLADRGRRAIRLHLDQRRQQLGRQAAQLEALSPLAVLARGYSLTLRADGATIVRSAVQVERGEQIQTRLADGLLVSRVESADPESAWPAPLPE